jgi:hypothetical protein
MDLEDGLGAATAPDPGFTFTVGGGCMMAFVGFLYIRSPASYSCKLASAAASMMPLIAPP